VVLRGLPALRFRLLHAEAVKEEPAVYECAHCGSTYVDRPAGFLGLDLETQEGWVESHWYRGFCSTEHASGWFAAPLPVPDQVMTWSVDQGLADWRFWAGLVGSGLLGVAILTLAVIGVLSLVA
jgi:hypothetical protein